MSSNSTYAIRKRRKPSQKSVKPASAEGAKSNPSKRHRDRLNGELDRLASMLPFHQDVISKLDKLTILRLSVGYLRVKGHFNVVLNASKSRQSANTSKAHVEEVQEGELLLQVINGFVLVVTAAGTVFYASSTIQDYLGFQQSDIVHQSVYEMIHTDDRAEFRRQLHWALNPSDSTDPGQLVKATGDSQPPLTYYNPKQIPPENSAFLERNFICRLRCLLDNSSGFLAMNFQGRLKFLHGQNERTAEGKPLPPQLALFAIACPLKPPSILEIRAKNFIYRTKHKLDFTPIACDAKGKIVLGYTEEELCYRGSGYQFIHAADMLYCAENHMRMMKTGESGLTNFRLLTKQSTWVWVQANARLVYKNGRPDFIIASQRVLTEEEGQETLKKRSLMLPFSFTTGEAVLYDFSLPKSLSGFDSEPDPLALGNVNQPCSSGRLDPNSLLGSMLKQNKSIYACSSGPEESQGGFQEPDEEELGGIYSSTLQQDVVSLSENSLFKQNPAVGSGLEESSCELLSFMSSLGIKPEDLEVLQQDEMFMNIEPDEYSGLENLTDEVLSYVEESLMKKAQQTPSFFSSQDHSQDVPHNPASFMPQAQSRHAFPGSSEPKMQHFTRVQSCVEPQSLSMQEQQRYLYRPQPLPCPEPYELSQVTLQEQNLQPMTLQPAHPLYPMTQSCVQNPVQQYHRLTGQGNGTGLVLAPDSSSVVFQPDVQQPGRFYLETAPVALELPCMNQLNPVSSNCNQEFPSTYIPVGQSREEEFSTQDLEDLLHNLNGVGQQKHGPPGEVQREEWCPWKPAGEL